MNAVLARARVKELAERNLVCTKAYEDALREVRAAALTRREHIALALMSGGFVEKHGTHSMSHAIREVERVLDEMGEV